MIGAPAHRRGADRLAELEAEIDSLRAVLARWEAALPEGVTVDQAVKIAQAVYDDEPKVLHPRGPKPHHWVSAMGEYLRGIR